MKGLLTEFQSYKVSKLQSFNVIKFQRYKVIKFQNYKVIKFQSFNVIKFQSFKRFFRTFGVETESVRSEQERALAEQDQGLDLLADVIRRQRGDGSAHESVLSSHLSS